MRSAKVYMKDVEAGTLTETNDGTFWFEYKPDYLANNSMPEISLTLPKREMKFTSEYLFPFFFSMLPEGANKETLCRLLKIDEKDYFGLLLAITSHDVIGAITIKTNEP